MVDIKVDTIVARLLLKKRGTALGEARGSTLRSLILILDVERDRRLDLSLSHW